MLQYETNEDTTDYLVRNFLPTILVPTRITDRSAIIKIIDHFYYYEDKSRNDDISVKSGNIFVDVSDHLPNFIIICRKAERKDLRNGSKIKLFT